MRRTSPSPSPEERMARLREFQLQRRVVNDVVHLYPLPTLVDVFWDPLN